MFYVKGQTAMITGIFSKWQEAKSYRPIEDTSAKHIADWAFEYLSVYFGDPKDAAIGHVVYRAKTSHCRYTSQHYVIALANDIVAYEDYCTVISHEMYHRLTLRKRGLHRDAWIDEMLAFLASKWSLEAAGLHKHSQSIVYLYLTIEGEIGIHEAKQIPRRKLLRMVHTNAKNVGLFYKFAVQMALELESILTREQISLMVNELTFMGWFRHLSNDQVIAVKKLFGIGEAA